MSHNPITGDKIITKPSKAYADNYDRVFGDVRSDIKYFKGINISHSALQWSQDAWRIDHPWLHRYETVRTAIRMKLQPISHAIGARLMTWGYVGNDADKILLHYMQSQNQQLAKENSRFRTKLSALEVKR